MFGVNTSGWLPDGVMHDLAEVHDSVDDEWVTGCFFLLPAYKYTHTHSNVTGFLAISIKSIGIEHTSYIANTSF